MDTVTVVIVVILGLSLRHPNQTEDHCEELLHRDSRQRWDGRLAASESYVLYV